MARRLARVAEAAGPLPEAAAGVAVTKQPWRLAYNKRDTIQA